MASWWKVKAPSPAKVEISQITNVAAGRGSPRSRCICRVLLIAAQLYSPRQTADGAIFPASYNSGEKSAAGPGASDARAAVTGPGLPPRALCDAPPGVLAGRPRPGAAASHCSAGIVATPAPPAAASSVRRSRCSASAASAERMSAGGRPPARAPVNPANETPCCAPAASVAAWRSAAARRPPPPSGAPPTEKGVRTPTGGSGAGGDQPSPPLLPSPPPAMTQSLSPPSLRPLALPGSCPGAGAPGPLAAAVRPLRGVGQ